jgi:hypothetical protein
MANSIEELREVTKARRWREVVESLLANSSPSIDLGDFGTYWIEGGHRIRKQVGDDRALVNFLRLLLAPYSGGPVALYRGENQDRLVAGALGFAWTSNAEVAEMFAAGLNAIGSGGVLLRATLDAPAIISGPNAHSHYLGEEQFTIDPFCVARVEQVSFYAPELRPKEFT